MTESGTEKRLVIDLDQCDDCGSCTVHCDYLYHPYGEDHGVLGLREQATFALVCRRCEFASCVEACPFNAIERKDDQVLKRHNLRCVSCKLCAHACPFGTIYTDMLPFYESHCDACLGRVGDAPACVAGCEKGALEYVVPDPADTRLHVLDEHLAARTDRWVKREVAT
jgi:Fe-S-cluster-containing hydrogenase component 2